MNLKENWPSNLGQIKGNNRQMRYWSPEVRSMLLKSREPEVEAFAQDRSIDPHILIGVAEATMRLGRIPDLAHYGLDGDNARAVTHFMADVFMNTEDEDAEDSIDEDGLDDEIEETTTANGIGPYLKFVQGVIKRAALGSQPKKMFDLPSQPEQPPQKPHRLGGVGSTGSVFNSVPVYDPTHMTGGTSNENPAMTDIHTRGGPSLPNTLSIFRSKARAFRRSRSGKFD